MKIRLAAVQPVGPKDCRVRQCGGDLVARSEHFRKYNICAATYDEAYCRDYAEEYLEGSLSQWIRRASEKRADLVLLPEFSFVPGVLAGTMPGAKKNRNYREDALKLYSWSRDRFLKWASERAKKTGMFIATSFPMADGKNLFNTGVLIGNRGELSGLYRKVHLPEDELRNFSPGAEYPVFKTSIGVIGFATCYDIQYPEHCACLVRMGAQIILHPSAGYTLPDETRDMGMNRLRVRASDSYCALVYAGFASVRKGFPNRSCVIASNGDVVAVVKGNTGIAVGDVEVGGKRHWPGDSEEMPDREGIRRACRRGETYGPLMAVLPSGRRCVDKSWTNR